MSSTTKQPSIGEVRTRRARKLGMLSVAGVAGIVLALRWAVRKTWRRAFPLYWVGAELGLVWLSGPLGIPAGTVGLAALIALITAVVWPARSRLVRAWRAAIVLVLGAFAVASVAAGGPAALTAHPFLTGFLPLLAAMALGWPWWHHLRSDQPVLPEPEPELQAAPRNEIDPLTAHWMRRWDHEVVASGVCAGTQVLRAIEPRAGVTDLILKLIPGRGVTPASLMKKGGEVEVALELDENTVGFSSTGKAARIRCSLTQRSYIAGGVPWTGPTMRDGQCVILTYVDGTPGLWTFMPPGFGVKGGLVVGTTGSGKSRALGVLIANLLHDGWMVAIGDSQNGQSLPAWKTKTDYHAGPAAVILLIARFHAEIMYRSKKLADAGVEVFDENDPRVRKLGFKKMMGVIDECQLVLIRNTPVVPLAEQAAETMRKTGCGLIFATQIPQNGSLGGSIRLRDALVGGNTLVLRLSNRGSGSTILPDDFVGDPFAIPDMDAQGVPTAGMGYLRSSKKVGMIGRTAKLDEAAAAAAAPHVPVVWNVEAVESITPVKTTTTAATGAGTDTTGNGGSSSLAKIAALFGGGKPAAQPAAPQSSPEWVISCLRAGPASAQALLDRPDVPVGKSQLYALLKTMHERGQIVRPAEANGAYTLPAPVSAGR
ncbi:ATP-binding protein [Actinoplanes sp. G11-F43]|uniref:ATP-binding protein n=1 Tax=Actinoplanes sp. G11-F43 TaxID=3424130 RepID=UPI003D33653C